MKKGFLERTLADISAALEESLFAERTARLPGVLQRLDPRVKVIGFISLIVAAAFSRHLAVLVGLYLLALALAYLAKVPLDFFVKRVWLFMPIFTGIIAMPALLNFVTPGRPLITLLTFSQPLSWGIFSLPAQLTITEQGLRTATMLVLRVATSVSFAVLLVLTTRWAALLKALRILHIPKVFVLMLEMTYRYVFLLLHTVNAMLLARKSRSLRHLSGSENRRWLVSTAATLLAKSYHLSNEVYLAMLSRGFSGESVAIDTFRLRWADWLWAAFLLAVALAIILAESLFWG